MVAAMIAHGGDVTLADFPASGLDAPQQIQPRACSPGISYDKYSKGVWVSSHGSCSGVFLVCV